MVAALNDEFDLINYNPYKGQTRGKGWVNYLVIQIGY